MNTTTTTQDSVQQDSETQRSDRSADPSQFQASPMSTQDQIARLAYSIWERRDTSQGSPEQDWQEAERQIRQSSEHYSR